MLLYTLGLAIPFLVLSVFSDYLVQRIRRLYRFMGGIKIASGCMLIAMGLLLMTDQIEYDCEPGFNNRWRNLV